MVTKYSLDLCKVSNLLHQINLRNPKSQTSTITHFFLFHITLNEISKLLIDEKDACLLSRRTLFSTSENISVIYISRYFYCCGAIVASEQQHIQDLRRIYIKGRRILELSTFYQNALHLTRIHCATFTRVHCATNNSDKQQRHEEIHRGVMSTVSL